MADGDVEFKSIIDVQVDDAIKKIESLGKAMDKWINLDNKTNADIATMQKRLSQARNEAVELVKAFTNLKVPTQEYKKLENMAQSSKKVIDKMEADAKRAGLKSVPPLQMYDDAKTELAEAQKQQQLLENSGKAFKKPGETLEGRILADKLTSASRGIEDYIKRLEELARAEQKETQAAEAEAKRQAENIERRKRLGEKIDESTEGYDFKVKQQQVSKLSETAAKGAKQELNGLQKELSSVTQQYGQLELAFMKFSQSGSKNLKDLADISDKYNTLQASIKDLGALINNATTEIDGFNGKVSDETMKGLTSDATNLKGSYEQLVSSVKAFGENLNSNSTASETLKSHLEGLNKEAQQTAQAQQNVAKATQDSASASGKSATQNETTKLTLEAIELLKQLKVQIDDVNGSPIKPKIADTEAGIQRANALVKGLKDNWNSTVVRLRSELAKLTEQQSLMFSLGAREGYEPYDKITTRIAEIRDRLHEFAMFQRQTTSQAATLAEQYLKAPEAIQKVARRLDELKAKQRGSKLNFGERIEMGSLQTRLNKYNATLASQAQAEREAGKATRENSAAKKAGVSAVDRLTRSHKNLDKATNNLKRSMHKGLVFITKYFLGFRSLFFLVRKLRTSVKEGLQNLVQFRGGANATNEAVTELQTSLLFVKNAWGAAFAPIINYVTPALTALIDLVAEAGNAIARFFATLTGQSTVIQAVKAKTGSYADTLNGAAGSAGKAADATDKLNDRLAAFDDLNVLGVDKDDGGKGTGGSGGGKGDNLPSVDEMFTEITPTSSFADMVKEAFLSGDFTAIGQAAGQKIKESLENIDWEGIKEVAGRIGTGLATLINGFTSDKGTFEAVGSTIAESLNTIFTAFNSFAGNTNWEQVGTGLMATINSFFDTTNWSSIGEAVSNSISGLMDFLSGAITEFDASKIINALYNFFAGIDYKQVFKSTGNLLASVLEGVYNLIDACMDPVAEWIVETFSNDGEFTFGAFLNGIKNSVKGIASWVQTNVFEPFIAGFCEKFGLTGDSGVGALFVRGADLIAGFLSGMIDKLKNIGSWIREHIFDPVMGGLRKVFGFVGNANPNAMIEFGGKLIDGFKSGVQKGFGAVRRVFNGLKNLILGIFDTIKDKIEKVWGKIYDAVAPIINGLFGVVASVYDAVRSAVNFIIDAINTLEWDIPDWVPFVGGKSFGFDIPPLPEIDLPELARGAVIPPNKEFLAVLGDQKQGTNIEAPLDTIVDAFRQVVGNLNVQNTGNQVLQVDGQTFARLMTPYVVSELGRRGYNVKLLEG